MQQGPGRGPWPQSPCFFGCRRSRACQRSPGPVPTPTPPPPAAACHHSMQSAALLPTSPPPCRPACAGEPVEGAFSRKRSFSKKAKRYGQYVARGERGPSSTRPAAAPAARGAARAEGGSALRRCVFSCGAPRAGGRMHARMCGSCAAVTRRTDGGGWRQLQKADVLEKRGQGWLALSHGVNACWFSSGGWRSKGLQWFGCLENGEPFPGACFEGRGCFKHKRGLAWGTGRRCPSVPKPAWRQ